MTKPNNSWEIEWEKLKDLIKTISVGQYNEKGVNIGYKQADIVIKNFITKTLQQQREEIIKEIGELKSLIKK